MYKGAIAAGDPQTAAAGAEMLKQGGNAVDAAVSAAFASFVAEATLVNICGGGVALVVDSRSDDDVMYDFFSDMPTGPLRPDADFHQVMIDFGPEKQPFYIGRASVAVPGVVAGLCAMAAERGTLSLSALLEPAIRMGVEGVELSPAQEYAYSILQPIFTDTPALADLYLPGGRRLHAGDLMHFPALSRTLERLGREGPDLFYSGDVARAIVADQEAHGGLVTADDLAGYRARVIEPIAVDYRGYTVMLPPPSSSGGVLVGFALTLLAAVDLSALPHNGVRHLRALAEVMRLTNVARQDWDRRGGEVDERIAWFLSPEHVADYQAQLMAILQGADAPTEPEFAPGPNDTTHISVVDRGGLLVSVTTSAGENAGFVVGDTGVCLNNMLGEIDLHPKGFHRWPPGERLHTMMTPVVVVKDGAPVLAVGSGGSNRIRSAILQVLCNVIDFGLPLDKAVNAARIHFEAGLLQAEGGLPDGIVGELRKLGYRVNQWPGKNMFFGGAHAVAMQGGDLIPAGDLRRGGSVSLVR